MIKSIFFSEKSYSEFKSKASIKHGLIGLIVTVLALSMPTDKESMILNIFLTNLVKVTLSFILLLILIYVIVLLARRRFIDFFTFYNPVLYVFGLSLILISVPALLISFLLFNMIFKSDIISLVLFSLIPYYNYILFGWLCENSAETTFRKNTIIALIAMTLLFLFSFGLRYITL